MELSIQYEILQLKLTQQGISLLYWLMGGLAILLVILSIKNLVKTSSIIGFKGANMPRAISLLILSLISVIMYIIISINQFEINLEALKSSMLLDLALLLLYLATREIKNAIEGLTPEE